MKIPVQIQKAMVIFGVGFVIAMLLRTSTKNKPFSTREPDQAEQKKNAQIVLSAYLAAVKAGETATRLEELNRVTEKEYGLRVFKRTSDQRYRVRDDKGNEIDL